MRGVFFGKDLEVHLGNNFQKKRIKVPKRIKPS